jgi:hypothetical protein
MDDHAGPLRRHPEHVQEDRVREGRRSQEKLPLRAPARDQVRRSRKDQTRGGHARGHRIRRAAAKAPRKRPSASIRRPPRGRWSVENIPRSSRSVENIPRSSCSRKHPRSRPLRSFASGRTRWSAEDIHLSFAPGEATAPRTLVRRKHPWVVAEGSRRSTSPVKSPLPFGCDSLTR